MRLTPAGRDRLDTTRRAVRAMEAELLAELDDAERDTLLDVVTRLATPGPGDDDHR